MTHIISSRSMTCFFKVKVTHFGLSDFFKSCLECTHSIIPTIYFLLFPSSTFCCPFPDPSSVAGTLSLTQIQPQLTKFSAQGSTLVKVTIEYVLKPFYFFILLN